MLRIRSGRHRTRATIAAAAAVAACGLVAGEASAATITGKSPISTFATGPGLAGNAIAVTRGGTVYTTSSPDPNSLLRVVPRSGTGASFVAATKDLDVESIALAKDSTLYVSIYESPSSYIGKIVGGKLEKIPGTASFGGGGIALDSAGDLFAVDTDNNKIVEITASGKKKTLARVADLDLELAIGPDGSLYALSGSSVVKVDKSGKVTKVGPFPKNGVRTLTVDSAGNVFAGNDNGQVFEYSKGAPVLIAGSGITGYSGDGGPAADASLSIVGALAFGPGGRLYIDDIGNNAIRVVSPGVSTQKPLPETLRRATTGTLNTPMPVVRIAADGGWVAAAEETSTGDNGETCDTIFFWYPGTGAHRAAKDRCGDTNGSQSLQHLSLAGEQALWVDYDYGNHSYCSLASALATNPKPFEISDGCSGEPDDLVGATAGQGKLLVFNHWSSCGPGSNCKNGISAGGDRFVDPTLMSIGSDGTSVKTLASGADSVLVVAANAGRIVLARPDGKVAVLSSTGSLVTTVDPGESIAQAALDGSDLVLLTATELLVYDAGSGKLRDRRALAKAAAGGATLGGVSNGVAVYTTGRDVYLVDLGTGKSTAFAPPSTTAVVATLTSSGLYYGYSTASAGRLAFVKSADVARSVS